MLLAFGSLLLSADEYELIARAHPSELRFHTIYCSPCKQSIGTNTTRPRQVVDGDDKLHELTSNSLTERMNALIEGCKAGPLEAPPRPSTRQLYLASPPLSSTDVKEDDDHSCAGVASPSNSSLPQLDGLNDSPPDEKMPYSQTNPLSPDGDNDKKATKSAKKTRPEAAMLSSKWLTYPTLQPPPVYAGWLVEHLNPERWITPVSSFHRTMLSKHTN